MCMYKMIYGGPTLYACESVFAFVLFHFPIDSDMRPKSILQFWEETKHIEWSDDMGFQYFSELTVNAIK